MTPEEFSNELGFEFTGTEMVAGVGIALLIDYDGEERYHLVYPNGEVNTHPLSEVWKDGNYTKGITRHGDREVMIDDDGVHQNW